MLRFPVERGHILELARATGEADADFERTAADPAVPLVAPLTFLRSSARFDRSNRLRPHPGEPWVGSGRTATGTPDVQRRGTGLLAEQRFDYHRPVLAGDVLFAESRSGDSWTKQGRAGGRMVFSELITDYRDEKGELVATAVRVTVEAAHVPSREA
ncbi:MaoC family dehydratase N-terminal domain-containing protein [Streptomyces sp. NPDC050625]|uniref:FAS1-like dehydratase domain-containing protein n=1 Tax=Streptomyces sp. NPDC050625 TaxID=3154629 RepID=UPI003420520B